MGPDQHQADLLNWQELSQSIKRTLQIWELRNVTIFGRVAIVNTLILSKLWYKLAVTPIPVKFVNDIRKMCVHFLWKCGAHLVSYGVLVKKKILKGG